VKFQNVKGTRDFYPEDMAVRNWIFQTWRAVSLRNGFEQYDSPIFEYLDLYTAKSGEEIVEQLYSFEDRGGRRLALRPEMTPTLARMINAKSSSLPRPIKWFSMPRLNRAEAPQRGRLREFFQWNIDIVGKDDLLADAEAIFVAVDFFREVGLTPAQIEMRISSRRMIAGLLKELGFADNQLSPMYALLDRKTKLPAAEYAGQLATLVPDGQQRERLIALFACESLDAVRKAARGSEAGRAVIEEVVQLFELLDDFGVGEFCRFDIGVVRGLGYYTGPVFEAYGKGGLKRAICGGGRYDDLLKSLGGEALSGVGFATSDVVIQDVLAEYGLLPDFKQQGVVDAYVIDAAEGSLKSVLRIVGELRRQGVAAEFSYKRQPIGKQLKSASARRARFAVIVEPTALDTQRVAVKDLASGEQNDVSLDTLQAFLREKLRSGS
jgi:histidyl-tRNA synthetase